MFILSVKMTDLSREKKNLLFYFTWQTRRTLCTNLTHVHIYYVWRYKSVHPNAKDTTYTASVRARLDRVDRITQIIRVLIVCTQYARLYRIQFFALDIYCIEAIFYIRARSVLLVQYGGFQCDFLYAWFFRAQVNRVQRHPFTVDSQSIQGRNVLWTRISLLYSQSYIKKKMVR